MGTYELLILALDKDKRPEEAHNIWKHKSSYDLRSVPWKLCDLMISIYYRNNMLDRLVKVLEITIWCFIPNFFASFQMQKTLNYFSSL